MHSLEEQKNIAKEVLHKLEIIDPLTILAGGAPRDWFFGNKANDLDFYIHVDECMSNTQLRFDRLGLKLKPMEWDESKTGKMYKCMEHLKRIYEGVYKGQKIQIMVMYKPTTTCVVSHFGTSVCKAWWKGYDVKVTLEFLVSHYLKIIFKAEDYTAKVLHVNKMVERYPDYKVLTEEALDKQLDLLYRKFNIYPMQCNLYRKLKERMEK